MLGLLLPLLAWPLLDEVMLVRIWLCRGARHGGRISQEVRALFLSPVWFWHGLCWVRQVSAMQRDSSTYCDEPEDVDEFVKWCAGFKLDDRWVPPEERTPMVDLVGWAHTSMVDCTHCNHALQW